MGISWNNMHNFSIVLSMLLLSLLLVVVLLLNEAKQINKYHRFCSVQFNSVSWSIGSSGGHEERFSRDPLSVFFFFLQGAVVCCPSVISSADHGITHPLSCTYGWLWRGCHGVWHGRTMQASISWQLPEEVPVDPRGSWSCLVPSRWSFALSRRCGEASQSTWFRRPEAFFQSQQAGSLFHVMLELAIAAIAEAILIANFCWEGAILTQGFCFPVLETSHLL